MKRKTWRKQRSNDKGAIDKSLITRTLLGGLKKPVLIIHFVDLKTGDKKSPLAISWHSFDWILQFQPVITKSAL